MVPEQKIIHMSKHELDTDLMPFTRMNSKWIRDLHVKGRTITLP